MWSLWRDLKTNCCDEKGCNFSNTTVKACNIMVCTPHQHIKAVTYWRVSHLTDTSASITRVIQVRVAFLILFESGLNEYALYLDCAGGIKSHKGYERSMENMFHSYREHWKNLKVIYFLFGLAYSAFEMFLIQFTGQYYLGLPCQHYQIKSF